MSWAGCDRRIAISIVTAFFGLVGYLPAPAAAGDPTPTGDRSPVARGGNIVSGSLSFSSAGDGYYENSEGERTQEWTVRPGGGHFIADGWALSFHLVGRWFTQGEVRNTDYAMGPVLEYYWDTSGDEAAKGKILPYGGLGYLWGQARNESPAGKTKFNSGLTTLTAGLAWMVSSQVATDISVNYLTGRFTQKVPEDGLAREADRWTLMIGFKAFIP